MESEREREKKRRGRDGYNPSPFSMVMAANDYVNSLVQLKCNGMLLSIMFIVCTIACRIAVLYKDNRGKCYRMPGH